MTYDEAVKAIKEGRARAHAFWMLIADEKARDGFALRPATWEGPGEYQRVTLNDGDDLGFLVKLPTFKHLPIRPIKKSVSALAAPAKHTAGPWEDWEAANGDHDPAPYRIDGPMIDRKSEVVAWVYREQDARAIAAVPDLIAALEALVKYPNVPHKLLADAHVALEKARGSND